MTENSPALEKIDVGRGISLLLKPPGLGPGGYPAGRIQKGLVLARGDRELAEEGIGFGVPLLKFRAETVFPGAAKVAREGDDSTSIIQISYDLDLVQRIALKGGRSINSKAFYRVIEYFSLLHRRYPPLRGMLTRASHYLRLRCSVETRFDNCTSVGEANVIYAIHAEDGRIQANVYLDEVNKHECTEIIIANEQGASYFDQYRDSNGVILGGNEIGTWDETFAEEASFVDSRNNVAFTLQKVKGTRMFRGRELVSRRLAWSGLNYVVPRSTVHFAYVVRIGAAR